MGEAVPAKKTFRNKAAKKHDKVISKSDEDTEEAEIATLNKRIQEESPASGTQGRR